MMMTQARGTKMAKFVNISEKCGDPVEVTEQNYIDLYRMLGEDCDIKTEDDGIYIGGEKVAEATV